MVYVFYTISGLSLEAQFQTAALVNVGSAITTGITEISGSGCYVADVATPSGHRGILKFQVSGGGAKQEVFAINPEEAENLDARLSEIHGLLGKNSALSGAVYSGNKLMSATIKLYDSATHAQTNDGSTGLLHVYAMQNTYDVSENLLTSKMTRTS